MHYFKDSYMSKKRAQGLSITTIIIAIIALIVIVVIIAIFTGRLGSFGAGLESIGDPTKKCQGSESQGGQGGFLREETCRDNENSIVSSDAIAQGKKCCKAASPTTKEPTNVDKEKLTQIQLDVCNDCADLNGECPDYCKF